MTWSDLFTTLREANIGLAVLAAWALAWRTAKVSHNIRDRGARIQFLFVSCLLIGYITTVGLSSFQAVALHAPSGPVSMLITILHLTAIGVSVHPPRPLGRGSNGIHV